MGKATSAVALKLIFSATLQHSPWTSGCVLIKALLDPGLLLEFLFGISVTAAVSSMSLPCYKSCQGWPFPARAGKSGFAARWFLQRCVILSTCWGPLGNLDHGPSFLDIYSVAEIAGTPAFLVRIRSRLTCAAMSRLIIPPRPNGLLNAPERLEDWPFATAQGCLE